MTRTIVEHLYIQNTDVTCSSTGMDGVERLKKTEEKVAVGLPDAKAEVRGRDPG